MKIVGVILIFSAFIAISYSTQPQELSEKYSIKSFTRNPYKISYPKFTSASRSVRTSTVNPCSMNRSVRSALPDPWHTFERMMYGEIYQ